MSRQIPASKLRIRLRKPGSVASSGKKTIPCPKCKNPRRGANRKVQNIKELRVRMQRMSLITEPNSNSSGIIEDSLSILHVMGIGVITDMPVQPNPRSPEMATQKIKADFSLLKLETDNTQIPNFKIFDKKSVILKRGETKFVKVADIVPFTETNALFKLDDFATPIQQQRKESLREFEKNRNLSGLVNNLITQQKRIPVKLMEQSFKITAGKGT